MELAGKAQIEGPDGHSKREPAKYHAPAAFCTAPENPPPTRWGCIVSCPPSTTSTTPSPACAPAAPSFFGEIAQYEGRYRLCYLRGPAGIIIALAEQIS